jgi:sugar (pentulose or hexulose) kinase
LIPNRLHYIFVQADSGRFRTTIHPGDHEFSPVAYWEEIGAAVGQRPEA